MERLSAKDLRTVLGVARDLGAIDQADRFRATLLVQLKRLVSYDIASWNVVSPRNLEAQISAVDPEDCREDGDEELLGAFLHQNPLVSATPGRVVKFSDYISLRELHRLDVYDLVYRPLKVERQMAFALPAPPASVIGVALNRRRPDFSERDRSVLEVAQPLITQAYERTATIALLSGMLSAFQSAAEVAAQAIIVLHPNGSIQFATPAAQAGLRELPAPDRPTRLPEPLDSWSQAQRRGVVGLSEPLSFANRTARFVRGGAGGFDAILLANAGQLSAAALHAAGLTLREAEVMVLVARGLTNTQIARELTLSERTVGKHLEHTYAKLGVSTRTAAVAWATGNGRASSH